MRFQSTERVSQQRLDGRSWVATASTVTRPPCSWAAWHTRRRAASARALGVYTTSECALAEAVVTTRSLDVMPSRVARNAVVRTIAVVSALLACLLAGCKDDGGAEPDPAPQAEQDPAADLREAARETLGAGAADIMMSVSSRTAAYSARGGMELVSDRYRVHVRVARTPIKEVRRRFDVAGVDGETYLVQPPDLDPSGGCWLDPHAPVGALGGAASVQEAAALAGVSVRLLRDGIGTAERVRGDPAGGTTYRVSIEPNEASRAPARYRGDEHSIVGPRRLARHLGPLLVRVDPEGLIRRLSLELRRFRSAPPGPTLLRGRRRERVSMGMELSGYGRPLGVRAPTCIAME